MRILKSEKGFSLVELLLVLGIMSFLTAVIYGVFINSGNVFNFNTEKINVQQDHRAIVDRMAPYIRMANNITIYDSYDSNGDKVRLEFSTISDSPPYNGIGFGIKSGGEFYYRKRRETSPGNFEWGNRMTFINSKVNSFDVSQSDGILIVTIEMEEDGRAYLFQEKFYPRVPNS